LEFLDDEMIEYCLKNTEYEPNAYASYSDFSALHSIMINFKRPADFLYMPQKIQVITNKFLKYIDVHLKYYDIYKKNDDPQYYEALDILSEIIPTLKQEIGLK